MLCLLMLALSTTGGQADMKAGHEAYAENDYVRAFDEWLKEAKAGNPIAQNNIGYMYRKARGAPISWEEAAYWYSRAAEQGMPEAMTNLGKMLDEGEGVKQDFVESYKWFLLASRRGLEAAEGHLKILRNEFMSAEAVAEAIKRADNWSPKTETNASSGNAE